MSERDPRDVPPADRVDDSATAPGGAPESRPHPSTTPGWAVPSPANSSTPAPSGHPGAVWPTQPSPGVETPATTPGGPAAEDAAAPAGPADGPTSSGSPLLRRKAVMGAAGAGAAVLLVGAGFLAGTQFGGDRGDTTRLVSEQSGPMAGGYGAPSGRGGLGGGQDRGQGLPGGQSPGNRDGDGDGDGPLGGAAAASFVTAGQVTAISGSTITLSTFQGGTATVTTTSTTTVGGTAGGSLSSLSVGQVIFVAGTKTGDGSYRATAIMKRPAGPGGLSHGDPGTSGTDTSSGAGSSSVPGDSAQGIA